MESLFGGDVGTDPQNPSGTAAPLAARMRPRRIEDFVGQSRLLAEGSARARRAADVSRLNEQRVVELFPNGPGPTKR